MLPIARRLQALGHEVAFLSPRDLTPTLAAAGLDVPCLGDIGVPAMSLHGRAPIENERFMGRYYGGMMVTRVLEESTLRWMVQAGTDGIASFRPDVVCADPIVYYNIIAAARAGVPWACVSPLLISVAPRDFSCLMMRSIGTVRSELSAQLVKLGLDGRLSAGWHEVVSPWLNILYASEDFVPRAWSGNDYSWYVPPPQREDLRHASSADFPWDALDPARPLVYASGGGGESLAFPRRGVPADRRGDRARRAGCLRVAARLRWTAARAPATEHHRCAARAAARAPRPCVTGRDARRCQLHRRVPPRWRPHLGPAHRARAAAAGRARGARRRRALVAVARAGSRPEGGR